VRNTFGFIAATILLFCACKDPQPFKVPTPAHIPSPAGHSPQKPQLPTMDKSPMDMIYYPRDYPILKMSGKTEKLPVARVIYSRPLKDGRSIFGNVVKFGSYWRLGANESTEIEFFEDVSITGQRVKKGRYILYCVPEKDSWTLKLNNDLYTWGLKVHSAGDLYSFEVPVTRVEKPIEAFTMEFTDDEGGTRLLMGWDSVRAALPIKPLKQKGV
jgi:hypothetical protein